MNKLIIGIIIVLAVFGVLWFWEGAEQNLPQMYSNSTQSFSIRLPSGYAVDESYRYQELGPGKDIFGIKFTIPASIATGTNLASDSYISVEEIPKVKSCTANLFLEQGTVQSFNDAGTDYSFASSTGAGAGNRYEETIYALSGTSADWQTCIAVRYFIHYGVFENYPAGIVREFDKQAILAQFDLIRRSLVMMP